MWNALRFDFQEFVSTVADDTSNVLSQLDTGLNDGEGGSNNNDDEDGEQQESNPVDHTELKQIMSLLRDHPGTYTEDLADEDEKEQVEAFLEDFSIDAKTDEIAQVLEAHKDTVQKHFADLSPTQVSYEDFWKRYFYRCNEERIARQLAEETERARQARAEAIQGGIDAVTNLFGGAVKAVTSTIAPEADRGSGENAAGRNVNFFGAGGRPPFVMNTAVDESGDDDEEDMGWDDDDSEDEEFDEGPSEVDSKTEQIEFTDKVSEDLQARLKQATEERDQIQQTVHMQAEETKALKSQLAVGGEGSGEAPANASDIEEMKMKLFEKEAELAAIKSKGSDDDMEDEGDKLSSLARELGNLSEDQLAQLKAEVFGISEETKQADADTVAALEQQIQELTQSLATKDAVLAEASKNEDNLEAEERLASLEQQVQELTQSLATKDAALAEATKNEDSGEAEKLAALEQQVQELTQSLVTKDAALADANGKLEATSMELEASRSQLNSDQANAANGDTAMQDLESKLQSVQASLDALQAEHESLQQSAQQAQEESVSQLASLEAGHAEYVASLTAQLEEANQKVQQGGDALKEKEAELMAAKQQPSTPMPSTPDSMSTGVKVDAITPAFTTPLEATKLDLEGDEEGDDWGDDWD